jgi:hypothetical protein
VSVDSKDFATAVALMRLALPLLDRAGASLVAARLQQAIDTAERTPPGMPEDALMEHIARVLDLRPQPTPH